MLAEIRVMPPNSYSILLELGSVVRSFANPAEFKLAIRTNHVIAPSVFLNWILAHLTRLALIDVPHHGPVIFFKVSTSNALPLFNVFTLRWEMILALAAKAEFLI